MSQAEYPSYEITIDDLKKVEGFSRAKEASVLVIFFDDMKGSTALKQKITAIQDEEAFQTLRREHDALLTRIISRDGAGTVIKSTGDGLLAVFSEPSTAVERAVEIQEALRHHPYLSIRIGLDMGQVRVEAAGGTQRDLFGRHVDWAARAESLADGGHIIVTRSVYVDAFGWIPKARVQWKEHGFYTVKEGEDAIEAFEPYNANVTTPMENLRGNKKLNPLFVSSAETHAQRNHPVDRSTQVYAKEQWTARCVRIGLQYGVLERHEYGIALAQSFYTALRNVVQEVSKDNIAASIYALPELCVRAILRIHPGGDLFEEDLVYLSNEIYANILESILRLAASYGLLNEDTDSGFEFSEGFKSEFVLVLEQGRDNCDDMQLLVARTLAQLCEAAILVKDDYDSLNATMAMLGVGAYMKGSGILDKICEHLR